MPFVQIIATIVLSGVVSGALVFGLQERRERAALLMQKAESAVEAFVAWTDQMQKWPGAHFDLFLAGQSVRDSARTEIVTIWSEGEKLSARAQMLIHIYLPDYRQVIVVYLKSYAAWIAVAGQLQQASLNGEALPEWAAASITTVGRAMVEARAEATATLYDAARRLAHAPFIVGRSRWAPRLRFPRKSRTIS